MLCHIVLYSFNCSQWLHQHHILISFISIVCTSRLSILLILTFLAWLLAG